MPSIAESLGAPTELAGGLAAGVNTLSENQTVEFTQYAKSTIPTDGFVFWVNTGSTITIDGSLHYATDRQQNEDETIDIDRIVFTALSPVDVFNEIDPDTLYVGTFEGLRFSWSARGPFYEQANLYHYVGNAVYPALATQLIDSASDLPAGPIVSNSLPIWLAQNSMAPVYPSFLVPPNVVPPYITAHVEPDATEAPSFPIMQWPGVTESGSPAPLHDLPVEQLAKDRVRLTMYGFNNQQAMQFYYSLIEVSCNTDVFGFGNSPVIRDAKRTQTELAVIAMKKTLDIDAWYFQSAADVLARRLILEAGFSSITT